MLNFCEKIKFGGSKLIFFVLFAIVFSEFATKLALMKPPQNSDKNIKSFEFDNECRYLDQWQWNSIGTPNF